MWLVVPYMASAWQNKWKEGCLKPSEAWQPSCQDKDMSGVHLMLAEHIDSTLRLHSETMPNHNCLFLPQAWSRLTIFNMGWPLVQLIHPDTQVAAARRLFYWVWHKDFNHVRVPKWYPFSRCSVCSSLKEMKTKGSRPRPLAIKRSKRNVIQC